MAKINRLSKDYIEIFDRIDLVVKAIPARIATLAVNFSKERFVKKNWIDKTEQDWKKTKKRKGSTLVASGRLKRSIRKISVTPSRVIIGTNTPYGQAHNDGLAISGTEKVNQHSRKEHRRKAHFRKNKRIQATIVKSYIVKPYSRKYSRKFEKRQFIGQSQELNNRISKLINKELNKAIKG